MKGFSGFQNSLMKKTVDPKTKKEAEELVDHTPEWKSTWGGTEATTYTKKISKRTKRLIEAGAPKHIIEQSKRDDVERFKKSN